MRIKLTVTAERTAAINPKMSGLFFEDISHAADGGLSAELVENRSFGHISPEFEYYVDEGGKRRERLLGARPDPSYGWTVESGAVEYLKDDDGYYYMRLRGAGAISNSTFGGFCLKGGADYELRLCGDFGSVKISAEAVSDGRTAASCELAAAGGGEYSGTLRAEETARNCRLRLLLSGLREGGHADIYMVSLKPADAVMGLFRRDMAEAMRDLRPAFLRFPGGCAVEGYDLKNAYRWKDTVGPALRRKQNFSRWAFKDPGYNQTYAIGFYEYFFLCEYLECEPLPVINAGMACQFNTSETVPLYDENGEYTVEFEKYLNDALDLIEFANGDECTKWGALRADMGRPEPFRLRMLAIGNEQWQTGTNQWFERYEAFEKTIHEKYPGINLIFSAGPRVGEERYDAAWERIRMKIAENPRFAYAVDEHNYNTKEWFFENANFYENYSREVPVYLGEYAAKAYESDGGTRFNDMISALSEAAFLCGLEKNGDVVKMASYAPLFSKRPPHSHWAPNMIWFDSETIVKTPNYYTQKMFAEAQECFALKTEAGGSVYMSAVTDGSGGLIIKAVNPTGETIEAELEIDKTLNTATRGTKTVLSADCATARNTFENPDLITPKTEKFISAEPMILKPYSFTVIKLPKQYSD